MCIIAVIPSDKTISRETLNRCWQNNPHGGGFMYTDGKRILIEKEMNSFKRYYKKFIAATKQYPNSNFVVHFRISTHGKINEANCHPFYVNDKLGFCHNGVIYNAPTSPDFSDTVMFNNTILKELPNGFLADNAYVELIRSYIGNGSKLAFLDNRNNVTIINEKAGEWSDGIWYSNSGYKADKYFDRGGTVVQTIYNNTKATQTKIGFTVPVNKVEKVAERMKTDKKLEKDIFGYAMNEFDSYSTKRYHNCDYCDGHLYTSDERVNGCCNKCLNSYASYFNNTPF